MTFVEELFLKLYHPHEEVDIDNDRDEYFTPDEKGSWYKNVHGYYQNYQTEGKTSKESYTRKSYRTCLMLFCVSIAKELEAESVEALAQRLFIRWMAGKDENCPQMPLTDENMVEDEKGIYYELSNGRGYTINIKLEITSKTTYSRKPYATWLMNHCRKIAKEALCLEA